MVSSSLTFGLCLVWFGFGFIYLLSWFILHILVPLKNINLTYYSKNFSVLFWIIASFYIWYSFMQDKSTSIYLYVLTGYCAELLGQTCTVEQLGSVMIFCGWLPTGMACKWCCKLVKVLPSETTFSFQRIQIQPRASPSVSLW